MPIEEMSLHRDISLFCREKERSRSGANGFCEFPIGHAE